MYQIISLLLLTGFVFMTSACGEKRTLHCDECGKEVDVSERSNMEEDWLLFCEECGDIEY